MKFDKIDYYLFFFLFFALSLTFGGHGSVVDENLVIQVMQSFFDRGELTVDKMHQALLGPDGKYYSRYGFGFPLFLIPFYFLGSVLKGLFGDCNAFFDNAHFFGLLWGQITITALTGWLFYRLCLEYEENKLLAAYLSLGLIFGTSVWPYSKSLFRLTFFSLIIILLMLAVIRYIKTSDKRIAVFIVCLIAYGLNVREDLILAFGWIGLYFLWEGSDNKDRLNRLFLFVLGCFAGFIFWGLHNYIRFETIFKKAYADLSFDNELILSIPQLLWGANRGLITYSPIVLFLPLAYSACKRDKSLILWMMCALMSLSYLILYGRSTFWHGGQCWGPRHMYFLAPVILIPAIWFLKDMRKWKWGLFGIMTALGMVMNWPGLYCHQGKYSSFFTSPPFFPMLLKYPIQKVYDNFDDFFDLLDFWWIRMIKLSPFSIWPIIYCGLIGITIYYGIRLYQSLKEAGIKDSVYND